MVIETRQKWTDLIPDTGLRISEVYDQGDAQYTPGIFSIVKKETMTGAQKNFTGKTGFGKLKRFDDTDNIPTVERFKTYTTPVIPVNYGAAVDVSANLIEDRDFDAQLDEMRDLSRAANYSIDESSVQLFNGGFGTAAQYNGYNVNQYGDGVPLFSTVHPSLVPGASTQSNASSTGIPLTHDNLEIARQAILLQQTDNGMAMGNSGRFTLVVPLALEKTAREITDSELQPQNGNNAINFYKGRVDVVSTIFLDGINGGSNTAWYLINNDLAGLRFVERQPKELNSEVSIRNKVVTYTVDARWALAIRDWRGVWGSKGDLNAYAA